MIEDQIPEQQPVLLDAPERNWTKWIAAGGCAVLLCAGAFVGVLIFAGPGFVQGFIPENIQVAEDRPLEVSQSNTMGDPNALVHIVEYGDFQCPYCLKFWTETEPQLIEEYVNTGKVYFEYRSFPFLGPESTWAAEAAYCAGDQGKFWEYHDTLYTNWTGENVGDFTQDKLIKYAEALNLNVDEFESCLSEEKHKGTVEQDMAEAEALGVHATPTLFVNGIKLEGAQPFSILKEFIEQQLDGNIDTQSG